MTETSTVETSHGTLRGSDEGGLHVFKGIPYAAPPVGPRRFAPPAPLVAWSGIRDAREFGARAIQSPTGLDVAPPIAELIVVAAPGPMSEDCLFLNIWTPALGDGGKRPVMVWLHGGAFVSGSGASPFYDGSNLARREDVVVVTLNHRLGLLGYLYLAELGGSGAFEASGNAGMLDIVAALAWLRDNIAAFGGDPRNVTLFGESGGGAKISVLMAMPAAKGLFHKAIIQSGPAVEMMTPADATAVARSVMERLALDPAQPEALLTARVEDLLEAQTLLWRARDPMAFANRRKLGFNPVIDGRHLPAGPFAPTAPALSAEVPLMIGTNKDEMSLFFGLAPWLATLGEADLVRAAQRFLGSRPAAPIVAAYRAAQPDAAPRDLLITIASDLSMRMPSLVMADRKTVQNGAPVYVYLFTWETPALEGRLKSCHALEIPFVFDNTDRASRLVGDASARAALARTMSRSWAQFARRSDPNHDGLPRWPAYSSERRPTMIFDEPCRIEEDPLGAERRAWL
jgi:para-nitrobenzyl esterase